ncbi:MAG: UxaA family hydrolase [Candidatus Methanomethylicia archaeon]
MSFLGYRRPDGTIGVRNYVTVISAGSCVNEIPVRIAERVKNVVPIIHNEGDLRRRDNEQIIRTLVGIGKNPNVAACLVVGLGCEIRPPDMLGDKIAKSSKPVEVITVEKIGDFYETINKGIDITRKLVYYASKIKRKEEEASNLTIGVKCAGSDTSSGLAGNPSVGAASDMIIEHGGTVIISETAEMIGAEHILAGRAVSREVADKVYDIVRRMEWRAIEAGIDIRGSEPTPANIKGGLTTIEEKSLGAIIKGGTKPIQGVLEYAEAPKGKGLYVMDSTAHTNETLIGFTAAGCQISIVSMGLFNLPLKLPMLPAASAGTPIIPVIKVSTAPQGKGYIDIHVDKVLTGEETIEEAGKRIFNEILEVASGKKTIVETFKGYIEPIAIYTTGPLL